MDAQREYFFTEALDIADDLVGRAVFCRDSANWVGRQAPENATEGRGSKALPHAKTLNHTFYHGTAGIALFLGQMWRFTKDVRYWDAARGGIIEGMRLAQLQFAKPAKERQEVFGFYAGALGTCWVAYELAGMLDDSYLAERAEPLLHALQAQVGNVTQTDLMSGHAGAIPALLSLHRIQKVELARELALQLGDEMLTKATAPQEGVLAWDRPSNERFFAPLTGFSHGTAGYAFALATLYEATGDQKWRAAAERALQYERNAFYPDLGGWADYRFPPQADGKHMVQRIWCHGSGGIGISRVLIADLLGDARALDEAQLAWRANGSSVREKIELAGTNYMLCHGVAGMVECQWIVEAGLGLPDALQRARAAGRLGVERFGRDARARWGSRFLDWPTGHPGHRELSMFTGIAGVGYHLLRLALPDEVPTVLVPGVSFAEIQRVPSRPRIARGKLAEAMTS